MYSIYAVSSCALDIFYPRLYSRYVVSTCNSDTDIEVNPESLLTTLDCGKDFIEDWIRENARYYGLGIYKLNLK